MNSYTNNSFTNQEDDFINHVKGGKIKPPNPPAVATGYEDDYIRELGDKIAALSPEKARELKEYLDG